MRVDFHYFRLKVEPSLHKFGQRIEAVNSEKASVLQAPGKVYFLHRFYLLTNELMHLLVLLNELFVKSEELEDQFGLESIVLTSVGGEHLLKELIELGFG